MNTTFAVTYNIGQKSEQKVITRLTQLNYTLAYQASSTLYFPFYDLLFVKQSTGETYTIEVKADSYPNDVIAIEYECNGFPSGISLSTADIHIIDKANQATDGSVGSSLIWSYTDSLRSYISEQFPQSIICNKGTTKCYLIPISLFTVL